ncbi:MAG: hypothetical protein ABH808_01545 [Candidatus Kuenenbacteria bacterium]
MGDTIIIKEADAIIYQIPSNDLSLPNSKQFERPFEIGLGDPEEIFAGIHTEIKQEIEKKLNKNITTIIRALLWLDEDKKLNIAFDPQEFQEFRGHSNLFSEYIQKMLERYQIKELYVYGEEKAKEIFERIEKKIWEAQTSAYAEKQKKTTDEFLHTQFKILKRRLDRLDYREEEKNK